MLQNINAKYLLNKFCNFHTSCEISKLPKLNFCINGLKNEQEIEKTKSKLKNSELNPKYFVVKKSDDKKSFSLHFSINPILSYSKEKIDEKLINFDEILLKKSYFLLKNRIKLNERFFDDENEIDDIDIQTNRSIFVPITENTKPLDIIGFDLESKKYMKLKDDYVGEKSLLDQLVGIVFRNTKNENGGYVEIISFDHVGYDHPNRKSEFFMQEDPRHGILNLFDILGWIEEYSLKHNLNWFILDGKDAKEIYKEVKSKKVNTLLKMYDKPTIAKKTSYYVSIPKGWIGYKEEYDYIGKGFATYTFGDLWDSYLDGVNAASKHLALMKTRIPYSSKPLTESFIDSEDEIIDIDLERRMDLTHMVLCYDDNHNFYLEKFEGIDKLDPSHTAGIILNQDKDKFTLLYPWYKSHASKLKMLNNSQEYLNKKLLRNEWESMVYLHRTPRIADVKLIRKFLDEFGINEFHYYKKDPKKIQDHYWAKYDDNDTLFPAGVYYRVTRIGQISSNVLAVLDVFLDRVPQINKI